MVPLIYGLKRSSAEQAFVIEYSAALCRDSTRNGTSALSSHSIKLRLAKPCRPWAWALLRSPVMEQLTAEARVAAEEAVRETLAAGLTAGISCNAELVEGRSSTLTRRVIEHDLLIVGHTPGDRGDESSRPSS